jgi:hypothetical protein
LHQRIGSIDHVWSPIKLSFAKALQKASARSGIGTVQKRELGSCTSWTRVQPGRTRLRKASHSCIAEEKFACSPGGDVVGPGGKRVRAPELRKLMVTSRP